MMNSGADNFIVKFPPDASVLQKSLLMSGLFLENYVFGNGVLTKSSLCLFHGSNFTVEVFP